jgi:murein DD-endopeptidase MepM/ murein hydrolase activator NlpD
MSTAAPSPGGRSKRWSVATLQAAAAAVLLAGWVGLGVVRTPLAVAVRHRVVWVLSQDPLAPRVALTALERFVAARSWGAVLDFGRRLAAQLPLTGSVAPVPDGRLVDAFGWHRDGTGYQFEAGAVLEGPVAGPVLASTAGIVRIATGTVWIAANRTTEVGYQGVTGLAVHSREYVQVGQVLGRSSGRVTVLVDEAGFPVNPSTTPYLGPSEVR